MPISRRVVIARKVIGKKVVRGKVYTYEYYTLPLNIYIPKNVIEKWGTEFVLERKESDGVIIIKPKKSLES